MISNRTRAARKFDFEITRMISDQIALHSVQLPLLTKGFTKFFFLNVHFILLLQLICSPLLLAYLLTGGVPCPKHKIVSVFFFFLFGSQLLSPKQNNDLFFHVQCFISESKRFYKSTKMCIFYLLALLNAANQEN